MNPTKTILVASAATSLFAAAGAVSAAVVGTGASVSMITTSCFVIGGHCTRQYDSHLLSLNGTGALDDSGTFTATSSGTGMEVGFPNSTITATETFTGSYNKGTGVFTPSAGSLDITSCSGSLTVCNGAETPNPKSFNTGVGGSVSLTAGGKLTGTALQPSAVTFPAVSSFYSLVVGPFTPVPAVPLPPAAWLLGSGLLGLVGSVRRRRRTA